MERHKHMVDNNDQVPESKLRGDIRLEMQVNATAEIFGLRDTALDGVLLAYAACNSVRFPVHIRPCSYPLILPL